MSTPSSRRNFLRKVASGALNNAPRLVGAGPGLIAEPNASDSALPAAASTEPALMPTACASIDELLATARELGLERIEPRLAEMARRTVRLAAAPRADAGASFCGGRPSLPTAVAHLDLDDAELIACLDLAALRGDREDATEATPRSVWVFQLATPDRPTPEAGGVSVAVDREPPPPPPRDAQALSLAPELTLPRPWSPQVAALELTEPETDAWTQLRTELAARQGVPLGDSLPRSQALHRLCGFPDERRGDMPLACELLARGFDLGGAPAAAHPQAGALEAAASRWHLLLQLSRDDELGWRWGRGFERLYLWSDGDTLGPESQLAVRAMVQ